MGKAMAQLPRRLLAIARAWRRPARALHRSPVMGTAWGLLGSWMGQDTAQYPWPGNGTGRADLRRYAPACGPDYLLGRESKETPTDGLSKLNNLVGKFDPMEFSTSARPTLINLFATLAYPDSPDYVENLEQIQKEIQECFTSSDLKHFVTFFDELYTVLAEISDASETPPEDK